MTDDVDEAAELNKELNEELDEELTEEVDDALEKELKDKLEDVLPGLADRLLLELSSELPASSVAPPQLIIATLTRISTNCWSLLLKAFAIFHPVDKSIESK